MGDVAGTLGELSSPSLSLQQEDLNQREMNDEWLVSPVEAEEGVD